jgi:hypothetical protein
MNSRHFRSRRSRSVLARAGLLAAVVTAASLFGIPAAAAGGGPPQGGGGCHMVASPTSTGLFHMMAGSANGDGAGNMVDMLSRFSPDPFCGL